MQAYLDNSATTPLCESAKRWMRRAMDECWGNPSSLHEIGLKAEDLLEESRAAVAKALRCKPAELRFTSGGTEANNLALFGTAKAGRNPGRRVLISAVEHPSVMKAAEQLARDGFDVRQIPVDRFGVVSLDAFRRLLTDDTCVVSVMAVNNELGAIEPVGEIAAELKARKIRALFHVDAVQAFGKLPLSPAKIGCDLMTVSAHKIHGPKGVGALWVRPGVSIRPHTFGGEQEGALRPGTEPMVCIAGFGGAAACLAPQKHLPRVTALRNAFAAELKNEPGVKVNSADDALPYILHLSLPGLPAEAVLNFLSDRGIYVSSGSACAKGRRSPVLAAAGLEIPLADAALRISLSDETTAEELVYALDGIRAALKTIRRKG